MGGEGWGGEGERGHAHVTTHTWHHPTGTLVWSSVEGGELTDVIRQEHDKEGSDQVIDALDIATGWMPHRPDEQDSLETLTTPGTEVNRMGGEWGGEEVSGAPDYIYTPPPPPPPNKVHLLDLLLLEECHISMHAWYILLDLMGVVGGADENEHHTI